MLGFRSPPRHQAKCFGARPVQLNADLVVGATVDSGSIPWTPSPIAGVERRMLERDGDEVARATSLVRYAAGSSFAPHTHGAGEEFLVLEGVFSDDTGDFPQGWYVRNPPGSRHAPRSAAGAVILVKLRQMPAAEIRAGAPGHAGSGAVAGPRRGLSPGAAVRRAVGARGDAASRSRLSGRARTLGRRRRVFRADRRAAAGCRDAPRRRLDQAAGRQLRHRRQSRRGAALPQDRPPPLISRAPHKKPASGGSWGLLTATAQWRPRSESNRRTRLCRPLHHHSATQP